MKIFKVELLILIGILLAQTASADVFQIGFVLPLSGDMKEYGTAALRGIQMARDDIGSGLKDVEFTFEDGQYDPANSTRAVQYLLARGRLDTLFVWGDYPAEALVPVAEKQKIPTFVQTITSDLVRGSRFSLRFISSADDFIAPFVSYVAKKELTRVSIVYAQDPYFLKLIQAIRKVIPKENITSVEEVSFEEVDFRSVISRMRATRPDIVAVYLMPGAVSTFFRQAQSLHFKPVFFGGDTFESEVEIKGSEGAMDGAIYSDNVVLPEFRRRYMEKFGNDSQVTYAANGYAFVELLNRALAGRKAPLQAVELMEIYRNAGPIKSQAAGDFSFTSENGDAAFRFPVCLKRVNGLSHTILQ